MAEVIYLDQNEFHNLNTKDKNDALGFENPCERTHNSHPEEAYQTLLDETEKALNQIRENFNQQLTQQVFKVVSQLFLAHIETPKAIENMIARAISEVTHYPNLIVHMHQQDIDALHQQTLKLSSPPHQQLKIVPDNTLTLGGIKIQTPQGILDASLETQFQRFKSALMQVREVAYV